MLLLSSLCVPLVVWTPGWAGGAGQAHSRSMMAPAHWMHGQKGLRSGSAGGCTHQQEEVRSKPQWRMGGGQRKGSHSEDRKNAQDPKLQEQE